MSPRARRIVVVSTVKYYVYVSDTKVDMIAAQVPRDFRRRIAAELKLDLKVFSISLAQAPSEETRYSKVALVTRHLEEEGHVRSIDDPGEFFGGILPMHWGPFVHHGGHDYVDGWPMVWFGGETETTTLGLAGSRRHVIGEEASSLPDTPGFRFTSYSGHSAVLDILVADQKGRETSETGAAGAAGPDDYRPLVVLATKAALKAVKADGIPAPRLEFVARRLFQGVDEGGKSVLLGSPIYVAYAD